MFQLLGKIILKGELEAITGLRIGGTSGGLKIGGLDLNVITDPEGRPYIPGSSLKGKMRALLEQKVSTGSPAFYERGSHACKSEEAYKKCPICKMWGTIQGASFTTVPTLTRLIIRDAFLLTENGHEKFWENVRDNLELQWTEVKMETAIDRIKGSALSGSLRQIERVPAGATFGWQMSLNVFYPEDKDLLKNLFEAMALLENDYLGGMGSRGYGQVQFKKVEVYWNNKANYEEGNVKLEAKRKINPDELTSVASLIQGFNTIKAKLA